jgi:hypothetical protein
VFAFYVVVYLHPGNQKTKPNTGPVEVVFHTIPARALESYLAAS